MGDAGTGSEDDTFRVDRIVIAACSPVLGYALEFDDDDPALTIPNTSCEALRAFLRLATSNTHLATEPLTPQDVADMVVLVVPLVHKYDCAGLLWQLKQSMCEHPHVEGILAIAEAYEDDAGAWLSPKALAYLNMSIFQDWGANETASMSTIQRLQKRPAILGRLFVHAMTRTPFHGRGDDSCAIVGHSYNPAWRVLNFSTTM